MAALNQRIFREKKGCLSSTGPEILAFGGHCSANIQPILNCFVPNFKLKYEDSENIKTDPFQLTSNQTEELLGTPGRP